MPSLDRRMHAQTTYYSVLGLPTPHRDDFTRPLTTTDIRRAYHKALLVHHPDKQNGIRDATEGKNVELSRVTSKTASRSVDEITEAFRVLVDEQARKEYDRLLLLSPQQTWNKGLQPGAVDDEQGGVLFDECDLDDLDFDELSNIWFKRCRCGANKAYIITEEDLEREEENREVLVQCGGCSLWIKVKFDVAVENEEARDGRRITG